MLRPYNGGERGGWIKLGEGGVEEVVHAGTVLGGDREYRRANAMENAGVRFLRHWRRLC